MQAMRTAISIHWFLRSVAPSVNGCHAVVNARRVPSTLPQVRSEIAVGIADDPAKASIAEHQRSCEDQGPVLTLYCELPRISRLRLNQAHHRKKLIENF